MCAMVDDGVLHPDDVTTPPSGLLPVRSTAASASVTPAASPTVSSGSGSGSGAAAGGAGAGAGAGAMSPPAPPAAVTATRVAADGAPAGAGGAVVPLHAPVAVAVSVPPRKAVSFQQIAGGDAEGSPVVATSKHAVSQTLLLQGRVVGLCHRHVCGWAQQLKRYNQGALQSLDRDFVLGNIHAELL